MRLAPVPIVLLAAVHLAVAQTAAVPDLGACLDHAEVAERRACLESRFGGDAADIAALGSAIDQEPGLVARLARRALDDLESDVSYRATLLELEGQGLIRIGRTEAGTASLLESLEVDDGLERLTWIDRQGSARWTAPLSVNEDRFVRVASLLHEAGSDSQTRRVLARALASGAGERLRNTWSELVGGVPPGEPPAALLAPPWYRRLPDLEIPLLEGPPLRLRDLRGRVVLLDFWASWCSPCLVELPHLQRLQDALGKRGLAAVAVNAQESEDTARSTAEALGLRVPIGMYGPGVDASFRVRSLPTVILADRQGRIRARWDGYRDGLESEIARRVRELLSEGEATTGTPVATVRAGHGALAVRWSREAPVPLSSVAVARSGSGRPHVVATGRGQLVALAADGQLMGVSKIPADGSRLAAGAPAGRLVGFRPGGQRVVTIETTTGDTRSWTAPGALMDVRLVDADDEKRLLLSTAVGLFRASLDGEALEGLGSPKLTRSAVKTASNGWVAVQPADRATTVLWLDAGGTESRRTHLPAPVRWLVGAESGLGMLPESASAAALGRFLGPPGAEQIAVATLSGHLVLVDTANGEVRFRAAWPRLAGLAAGDLDGDGRDELLVVSGRTVTAVAAVE